MIIVSYPANPVCTLAPDQFYCDLIQWAKKHHVLVIHDNAYSELVYDGKTAKSFLSFEGAKDVGIEFNSLSKTYNMTGCRISFVVGNADMIHAFKTLRSQIDYGIFLPVQYAAIAALTGPQDSIALHRSPYSGILAGMSLTVKAQCLPGDQFLIVIPLRKLSFLI